MDTFIFVLQILLWVLCPVAIGLILLQGAAGDISSAFGGGGQLDASLGVGAHRKMAQVTGALAVTFFVVVLVLAYPPRKGFDDVQIAPAAPVAAPPPAEPPPAPVVVPAPEQPKADAPVVAPEQPKIEAPVVVPAPEQPKADAPVVVPAPEQPKADAPVIVPAPEQPKADAPVVVPAPEQPKP